jgi:hypothetical protein
MRNNRRRILILLLNTLVLLVVLELLARLLLWYDGVTNRISDQALGYSASGFGDLQPNLNVIERTNRSFPYLLQTNSAGLRNSAEINDDPAVFRILALGDSFTFGYFVDNYETYPARLEERLNQLLPTRFQVLNAGVPGYTIADELSYLKDKGFALEPDLVIIGFYTNDILDFYPPIREHFAREVILQQRTAFETLTPLQRFLLDNSGIFRAFWNFRLANTPVQTEVEVRGEVLLLEGIHEIYQNLTFFKPDDYPDEWNAYERVLRETLTLLEERAIPTIVVAFPDLAQLPLEGGLSDAPQQMLARVTQDTDTSYLDLLPVFRVSGDIASLYLMYYDPSRKYNLNAPDAGSLAYSGDGHLSGYGNLVAARALADLFIENGLVPRNSLK